MSEGVQKYLWGGYHNTVRLEDLPPQCGVLPLVRIRCARYQSDGYGYLGGDDVSLLLHKGNCGRDKP